MASWNTAAAGHLENALAVMRLCGHETAETFFSERNLDYIQRELVRIVKTKTGLTIDRQSDRELVGIMQGVYEAFATHTSNCAEIERLNDIVLDIAAEQCIAGVEAYQVYLKDASTLPEPLERGIFASIKGERSLDYGQPGIPR